MKAVTPAIKVSERNHGTARISASKTLIPKQEIIWNRRDPRVVRPMTRKKYPRFTQNGRCRPPWRQAFLHAATKRAMKKIDAKQPPTVKYSTFRGESFFGLKMCFYCRKRVAVMGPKLWGIEMAKTERENGTVKLFRCWYSHRN